MKSVTQFKSLYRSKSNVMDVTQFGKETKEAKTVKKKSLALKDCFTWKEKTFYTQACSMTYLKHSVKKGKKYKFDSRKPLHQIGG
jgi:hypothetical protein